MTNLKELYDCRINAPLTHLKMASVWVENVAENRKCFQFSNSDVCDIVIPMLHAHEDVILLYLSMKTNKKLWYVLIFAKFQSAFWRLCLDQNWQQWNVFILFSRSFWPTILLNTSFYRLYIYLINIIQNCDFATSIPRKERNSIATFVANLGMQMYSSDHHLMVSFKWA